MAAPPRTKKEREGGTVPPLRTRWLGLDGALRLLARARTLARRVDSDDWCAVRDAHLAAFATLAALRSAECRRLTCGDVREEGGARSLDVVGKGGRRRRVPCYRQLDAVAQRWLTLKRARGEATSAAAPLFAAVRPRTRGRAFLDHDSYEKAWLRALRACGIETRVGPGARDVLSAHAARHTGVMLRWVVSGRLEDAARFAGHLSTATTYRFYYHLIDDVDEARAKLLAAPEWREP